MSFNTHLPIVWRQEKKEKEMEQWRDSANVLLSKNEMFHFEIKRCFCG